MSKNFNRKTETLSNVQFSEILNIDEIQRLQDLFSDATGVSSIITFPDGKPITKPSNFCDLCSNLIRKSSKGRTKCMKSNELIGRYNPEGPLIESCQSCGMWNAGASITVGNQHMATWIIGQVRTEEADDQLLVKYADDIDTDRVEFRKAYRRVPFMPLGQFRKVSNMLFAYANEISEKAYNNLQLKRKFAELEKVNLEKRIAEEQYRILFERSNDAIFSVDRVTGIYLNANKAAENLTGRSLAELKRLKTSDLTPKEADKRMNRISNTMETTELGEVEYLRPDCSVRTALLSSIPVSNNQVFGIARDVTDRNQIEQSLQKSEKLYRSLFENMLNGFAYCQMHFDEYDQPCDFTYLSVNSAFETMTGLKDVVGKKVSTVIPGIRESDPELLSRYGRVSKTGKPDLFEMFVASMQMWFSLSIYSPEPGYFVAVFDVITERKQEEEALKYSHSLNEATIESIHNGILVVSEEGKVIKANTKFATMWGIPEEILASGDDKIIMGSVLGRLSDPDGFIAKVAELYEKPETESLDVINLNDGRIFKRISKPMYMGGKPKGRVWSFLDITDRIRAEEEIKNNEIQLKQIIESAGDPLYLADFETKKIILANGLACKNLGYSQEELLTKKVTELVSNYNSDEEIDKNWSKMVINNPVTVVSSHQRKDGSTFPVEIRTNLIIYHGRKAMLGFARDISERIQAEQLLKANEFKFRIFADYTVDWEYWEDEHNQVVYMSPSCERLTGYTQNEFISSPILLEKIVHPDDRELLLEHHKKSYHSENEISFNELEFRIIKKDGSEVTLFHTCRPIFNDDKKFLGRRVSNIDITERRRIEEALKESEERFRLLIENQGEGVTIVDPDENLLFVNPAAESIFGVEPGMLAGQNLKKFVVSDQFDQVRKETGKREKNEKSTYEVDILTPSGIRRSILVTATPQSDENGKFIGSFGVIRDITERKKAEKEIVEANIQLSKLNAEKDKFFSIIAHDLRSPFNGFLGLTQLMAEDLPSLTMAQAQELAVSMKDSATNLYSLLENLLKWSQFQKGSIPFAPEVIQLKPVIDECIAVAFATAQNKGIALSSTIPENIKVFADSNMFQTVIRNLVSNALKFTPKGGEVSVSAKVAGDKSVEISVRDSGIGMNQTMIDNLFRPDVRTSRKGTDNESSTGLGLLLCKEFVEKHGGRIWVESEVGKGSVFYLTMPDYFKK